MQRTQPLSATRPCTRSKSKIKVEFYLSNYAKKLDLKSATGVFTLKFGQKTDLDSLKSDFDRSEIDKLETSPVDLSELSNVVKNEVVKKDVNDKLVKS